MEENRFSLGGLLTVVVAAITILGFLGYKSCDDLVSGNPALLLQARKMTFEFRKCDEPKFVKGKLRLFYDIKFSFNEFSGVSGYGFKHSQVFNGKPLDYSKTFKIDIAGKIVTDSLVATMYEENHKRKERIIGRIAVSLIDLRGEFSSGIGGCKGRVLLE